MNFISLEQYKSFIKSIKRDFGKNSKIPEEEFWESSYTSYLAHEAAWWKIYFEDIFLRNYIKTKEIRIYLWESGPETDFIRVPLPHTNYAFANLNHFLSRNKYLARICGDEEIKREEEKEDPTIKINLENFDCDLQVSTKKYGLTALSKKNVLVIDLYPFHGIKISNGERNNKNLKNILKSYSIPRLEKIKQLIAENNKQIKINISRRIHYLNILEPIKTFMRDRETRKNFKNAINLNGRISWKKFSP